MTSIAKLKDKARKHEQKEDWQAAIEVYRKVLDTQAYEDELDLDLGLFNRIGDLHLRLGQTDEAVSYYETAADKYAESGFYNNAIALCNKALRHRPDRPATYLKLSRLCTEQGFQTDARRWILEYADRQVAAGEVEAALSALEEFAELSDDPEVRELLGQQLASHDRYEEAIDQLRMAYALRVEAGQEKKAADVAEKARAIDPDVDLESEEAPGGAYEGFEREEPGAEAEAGGAEADLRYMIEPTVAESAEEPEPSEGDLEGLETRTETTDEAEVEGVEGLEPTAETAEPDEAAAGAISGLETSFGEAGPETAEAEDASPEGLETFDAGDAEAAEVAEASEPEPEPEPEPELAEGSADFDDEDEVEPLPLLDTGYEDEPEPEEAPLEEEPEYAGGTGSEIEAGYEVEEPVDAEPVDAEPVEAEPADVEFEEEEVEPLPSPEDEVEALSEEGGAETVEAEPEADEELVDDGFEPAEEAEPAAAGGLELSFDTSELPPSAGEEDAPAGIVPDELAMDLEALDLGFDTGEGDGTDVAVEDLDVEATLDRAKELVSRGLIDGAMRELRLLGGSDAGPEAYREALAVVTEVIRRDENNIPALQRRVEYAARVGEPEILVDAYLDLAVALERNGAETKAKAVYRRALAVDPSNEEAREALGEEAPEEETVDLQAILREMEEEAEAEGGGRSNSADPSFSAMLEQFRAKVSESADPDEAGDHYDLGLAFKEMGLIDEAIAEFQTALTGGEERLKVYEELGQCFVLKGQYNVAIKVFDRASKVPHTDEDELLGVYYHLGQCYEELGRRQEAKEAYRKVLSIDDSFADVPDRMARL